MKLFAPIVILLAVLLSSPAWGQTDACCEDNCCDIYIRYKPYYCSEKYCVYKPMCGCCGTLHYETNARTKRKVFQVCENGRKRTMHCYDTFYRTCPVYTYYPITKLRRVRQCCCYKVLCPDRVYERRCCFPCCQ